MKLLFLDTETGGLEPERHSLLQVGMVMYTNGEIKGKFKVDIKHQEYTVTARAMEINGINLAEHDKTAVFPAAAVQRIMQFLGKYKVTPTGDSLVKTELPILTGHNVAMDRYMVRKLFADQGWDMDDWISYRSIDTMSLLWVLYIAGKIPLSACSFSGAVEHFGIQVPQMHDALCDAVATAEIYEHCMRLLGIRLKPLAAAARDVVERCPKTGLKTLCSPELCASCEDDYLKEPARARGD